MKNLEAKFQLADLTIAARRATTIGYAQRAILNQRDTFFRVTNGKLKLREEDGNASLIFYHRAGSGPLMLSTYDIVKIPDVSATHAMLAGALGVITTVTKRRTLMMRDNVRLHLDHVERLGDFGEIEAVIADGDDPERGRGAVDELLAALEIAADDLIDVSYFELQLASSRESS
jgi:predicted adenylyl cyclase CyaB